MYKSNRLFYSLKKQRNFASYGQFNWGFNLVCRFCSSVHSVHLNIYCKIHNQRKLRKTQNVLRTSFEFSVLSRYFSARGILFMNDKTKLDIACTLLSIAIKKCEPPCDSVKRKWVEMSLQSTCSKRQSNFKNRLRF